MIAGGRLIFDNAIFPCNECVCLQYVAQSEFARPPKFEPAKQELMACAYELVPIDFERRAWVSTVMSGKATSCGKCYAKKT
jgi:hypothetical protein